MCNHVFIYIYSSFSSKARALLETESSRAQAWMVKAWRAIEPSLSLVFLSSRVRALSSSGSARLVCTPNCDKSQWVHILALCKKKKKQNTCVLLLSFTNCKYTSYYAFPCYSWFVHRSSLTVNDVSFFYNFILFGINRVIITGLIKHVVWFWLNWLFRFMRCLSSLLTRIFVR